MLGLNRPGSSNAAIDLGTDSSSYKLLVLDAVTKDIVAPLIRVDELRNSGVTLHMQIMADRQPIPDVAAVYFVEPSEENVARIVDDASRGIYDTFYLNFSSQIGRELMERLAQDQVDGARARAVQPGEDQGSLCFAFPAGEHGDQQIVVQVARSGGIAP